MRKLALALLIALLPSMSDAATYYVRTDGSDSNNGLTNTAGGAWRNISRCANMIVANDTCRVQAGSYTESVTETTSGSAGPPIQYVTYVADGAVTMTGMFTISASYVRVIGFTVNANGALHCFFLSDYTTGIELWHNTGTGFGYGFVTQGGSTPNDHHTSQIMLGNTSNGRTYSDAWHYAINGGHNIVAYNTMNQSDQDFVTFYGPYVRIFNNYAWGPNPNSAAHTDFAQTGVCCSRTARSDYFTLEANFYIGSIPASVDQHFTNQETNPDNSTNYLSRRNVVHSLAGGGQGIFEWSSVYIIHDAYIFMNYGITSNPQIFYVRATPSPRIYNTLFVQGWDQTQTTPEPLVVEGSTHDYNLGWDIYRGTITYVGDFNTESHTIKTADPLFVDYPNDGFTLQATSPAVNAGRGLATVTVGGTNVTAITVDDAGYFRGYDSSLPQYGGHLAPGDLITVGATPARISSISGNVLTLTGPITASVGATVNLGNDTTPDMGPYPYRSDGYTLSATHSGTSTITVTPNDANLVRFVVCYSDGVPYEADSTSPYTCAAPTGTFSARVYPLYASKTLWAVSTSGSAPTAPNAPTNVRIR